VLQFFAAPIFADQAHGRYGYQHLVAYSMLELRFVDSEKLGPLETSENPETGPTGHFRLCLHMLCLVWGLLYVYACYKRWFEAVSGAYEPLHGVFVLMQIATAECEVRSAHDQRVNSLVRWLSNRRVMYR
jgi:hypothetical protein